MMTARIKIADSCPQDTALILRMDGHADGSPEVCAAISALTCMLQCYLYNDPEVRVSREIVRSGDVSIIAAGGLEFRAVCRAFLCGMLQIGQGYPEMIKISQNF